MNCKKHVTQRSLMFIADASRRPFAYSVLSCSLVSVVFVVVFGINSAVAMPGLLKYRAKARQAEGKANIKNIFVSEAAYFAEKDTYTEDFDALGWQLYSKKPDKASRYSYYISVKNGGRPDSTYPLPKDVIPYADKNGFLIVAVGNIDDDPTLDVWTINENNELLHLVNDLDD